MAKAELHPAIGSGKALQVLKALSDLPAPLRDTLLALAGQSPEKLAKRVAAAFQAIDDAMQATKVQRLVVPGAKGCAADVREYVDIDHTTRLNASDQLFSVVGMYPSRGTGSGSSSAAGQPVTVNIIMRDVAPHMQALPEPSKDNANDPGIIDAEVSAPQA